MATRDELYPSQWLKALDVERPIAATIDRCTIETIGQGTKAERKPVLHFHQGTPKPCVLNKTNFEMLVTITGYEDSDDWGGAVVELFAIDVMGPNGPTRGVRLRRPRPRGKTTGPIVSRTSNAPAVIEDVPPPDDIDAALQPLHTEDL